MDISKLKLYNCFDILDKNFFNDFSSNIDKRIIFQKYGLFFAKIFDLQFGRHSLYLHGPYNSTLADVGYEIYRLSDEEKKIIGSELDTVKFNEIAQNIIKKLRENLTIDNVKFLEVFSTYFYLINYRLYSPTIAVEQTKKLKADLIDSENTIIKTTKTYKVLKKYINEITQKTILL